MKLLAILASFFVLPHTSVNVSKIVSLGPCISQSLRFIIVTPDGYQVDRDGSWLLELDGAQVAGKPDFSTKPTAFIVESRCGVRTSTDSIRWKIDAFARSIDGTKTIKDTIEGNL